MINLAEVRLWDLYKLWCEQNELVATIKGYVEWFEDKYDEEWELA